MSFNESDLTRDDLVNAALSAQGLKPSNGGGGGGGGPWYNGLDLSGAALLALDFTGREGASVLSIGTGGIHQASSVCNVGRTWISNWASTDSRNPDLAGTAGVDQRIAMTTGTRMATRPNICSPTWTAIQNIVHMSVWSLQSPLPQYTEGASTNSANYYGLYGGIAGSTPSFQMDSSGGAAVATSQGWTWADEVSTSHAVGEEINFEGLTGWTAGACCLIEMRFVDGQLDIWANGFQKVNRTRTDSSRTDTYLTWGTTTVNSGAKNGMDLHAVVQADASALSTSAQASIRAAMLADFGITEWDGVGYYPGDSP